MIKYITTNMITIKNIYITIKKTLNIYIRNLAKIGNITLKRIRFLEFLHSKDKELKSLTA